MLANVINILGSEMGAASHWPVYRQSAGEGEHTQYRGEGLQGRGQTSAIYWNKFSWEFYQFFWNFVCPRRLCVRLSLVFLHLTPGAGITNIAVHSAQCRGQAPGRGGVRAANTSPSGGVSLHRRRGQGCAQNCILEENIKVKMNKNPEKNFIIGQTICFSFIHD